MDVDLNAASPQAGDDVGIVEVAAGLLIQPSGKDQMEFRVHSPDSTGVRGPSNVAQARWDSCSVTFRLSRSLPPSPSAPSLIRALSRRWISPHRNSVVVLAPDSSGTSSRLR